MKENQIWQYCFVIVNFLSSIIIVGFGLFMLATFTEPLQSLSSLLAWSLIVVLCGGIGAYLLKFAIREYRIIPKPGASEMNTLAKKLQSYPPLLLPHQGNPLSLSNEQAEANLAYVLDVIPERLKALKHLLIDEPIVWPDSFSELDVNSFVDSLHHWAGMQWPTLQLNIKGDENTHGLWLAGERSDENIAFSLVADVALTLGELIRYHRPSLNWGVDLDPLNRSDNMETVNRVMLLGYWRQDTSKQIEIDIEGTVVNRLLNPEDTSERFDNSWLRLVQGAINGGYEGDAVEN